MFQWKKKVHEMNAQWTGLLVSPSVYLCLRISYSPKATEQISIKCGRPVREDSHRRLLAHTLRIKPNILIFL